MSAAERFAHFAAIDWSGAVGERHQGIAIALCGLGDGAPWLVSPPRHQYWSRLDVLEWLVERLPPATLVGFDMGISLAFADCDGYFPGWAQSPKGARALWPRAHRPVSKRSSPG